MFEKHAVSLEVAKKLKKYFPKLNGINTFFHWVYDETWSEENGFYNDWFVEPRSTTAKKGFPAPILSEMLELLPGIVKFDNNRYDLAIDMASKTISYDTLGGCYRKGTKFGFQEANPATAAAQLLIWLVDNKYVEVGR